MQRSGQAVYFSFLNRSNDLYSLPLPLKGIEIEKI